MTVDWTGELAAQLDWPWRNQLRPRLDGLTGFWEPVPGMWPVRPHTSTAGSPTAGQLDNVGP